MVSFALMDILLEKWVSWLLPWFSLSIGP